MPSSHALYYIPLATSPRSLAQSPLLDSPTPDTPPPPSPARLLGCPLLTRGPSLLSRRAFLYGGLLSLLTLVLVLVASTWEQLSLRAVEIVTTHGTSVADAGWDKMAAGAGTRASGVDSTRPATGHAATVPYAGGDMGVSQADPGVHQLASALPANLDALDHPLLPDSGPSTDATACAPDVLARVNQAASWTVRRGFLRPFESLLSDDRRCLRGEYAAAAATELEPLRYSITVAEDSEPLPPPWCLAHAIFAARLVSVSPSPNATGAVGSLDAPEAQTLLALDPPTWQPESSSYSLTIPALQTLPRHRYKLQVRLEFGYYPGLSEGVPCGPGASACRPATIVAAEGHDGLRYLGEEIAIAAEEMLEVPLRDGECMLLA